MNRNIRLAYVLAVLKNSWFWLGIWVLYYLRFTDYAGIGLIETVLIVTMTAAEIPTGAVADFFGKKRTLILSFVLQGAGNLMMGTATSFQSLALAVFVAALGGAFFSGTLDAFIFDTLKSGGKEQKYDHAIATVGALGLLASAVFGGAGGFLYAVSPGLPFFTAGGCYLLGAVVACFLDEPDVDSLHFSLRAFVTHVQQGFRQLTKSDDIRTQTVLLLSIGVIVVITDEMLNSFLGVEFGMTERQLGVFWAVTYVVSAFAARIAPMAARTLGDRRAIFLTGTVIAVSLLVSPVAGLSFGAVTLLTRSAFQAVLTNLSSVSINRQTESRYRTVTISTFNMVKNIPYVATAFLVGSLSAHYSAKHMAVVLGITLFFLLVAQYLAKMQRQSSG